MGAAANGIDMRWEITTCMQSPAKTYSFARATAARNCASLKLRVIAAGELSRQLLE